MASTTTRTSSPSRTLDDAVLADYLGHLVDNGHSRNTATKTMAAARRRAKFTGTKGPAGPRTRAALSRIGVRGERAPGAIEWKDLASAVPGIEGESLSGCRDAAIIALGCAVDLSAAEMTALDADDLFRKEDGQWRIRIRGSGSDDTGEAPPLDDATALKVRTWLGKKNITCGPMFPRMAKHRGAHERMTEFGAGSLTLTPDGQSSITTDLDLVMASGGVRALLVEGRTAVLPRLTATGDVLGVRTHSAAVEADGRGGGNLAAATAEVNRVRLGVEASWPHLEVASANVSPRLELGLRRDGGDAETGMGIDVGGGVIWTKPDTGLSARVDEQDHSRQVGPPGGCADCSAQPRYVLFNH